MRALFPAQAKMRTVSTLALLAFATAPAGLALAAPLDPNDPMFDAIAAANAGTGDWSQAVNSVLPTATAVWINTDQLTISAYKNGFISDQLIPFASGMIVDQGPSLQHGVEDWNREVAAFVFPEDLLLGDSLPEIIVTGSRPLALLGRGDVTVDGAIDVSGQDGDFGPESGGGLGVAGGGNGGDSSGDFGAQIGHGPGRGFRSGQLFPAPGGGFGGPGQGGKNFSGGRATEGVGRVYGNLLERLQGGSGGVGAISEDSTGPLQGGAGGAGGGALEIAAIGQITIRATLRANGGNGGDGDLSEPAPGSLEGGGGGGSGGGILIHGDEVNLVGGQLEARGGNAGLGKSLTVWPYAGAGGGGRIDVRGFNAPFTIGDGGASSIHVGNGAVTVDPIEVIVPAGKNETLSAAGIVHGNDLIQVRRDLTIEDGASVTLSESLAMAGRGDLWLHGDARFDLAGNLEEIAAVFGDGTVELGGGALHVGSGNRSGFFAGSVAGPGTLTKTGGGRIVLGQELSGDVAVNVPSGTLELRGGIASSDSRNVLVGPGGALEVAGALQRSVNLNGTLRAIGPLALGRSDTAGEIDYDGTLDIDGHEVELLDAGVIELGAATNLAAGGRLTAENGAAIASGAQLNATGPAVIDGDFTNNGMVNGPTAADEFLTFNDNVDGAGGYTGNVEFLQNYSPGNSPAAVALQNLTLADSSTLEIELGGLVAGDEFDQLLVSGDAMLAGEVDISLINGFTPSSGDAFTILDVGAALAGQFAGLDEGAVVGSFSGANLVISYQGGDGNDVILSAIAAALLGDANGDGVVNTLDIDPFVLAVTDPDQYAIDFAGVDFLGANDINADGFVSTLDIDPFVDLLTNPTAVSTPEPASCLIAAAGAGLLVCWRRRVRALRPKSVPTVSDRRPEAPRDQHLSLAAIALAAVAITCGTAPGAKAGVVLGGSHRLSAYTDASTTTEPGFDLEGLDGSLLSVPFEDGVTDFDTYVAEATGHPFEFSGWGKGIGEVGFGFDVADELYGEVHVTKLALWGLNPEIIGDDWQDNIHAFTVKMYQDPNDWVDGVGGVDLGSFALDLAVLREATEHTRIAAQVFDIEDATGRYVVLDYEGGWIEFAGNPDIWFNVPAFFGSIVFEGVRVFPPLVGDANGDGVIDTRDIDPFVQALSSPGEYASAYPTVDLLANNDINADGTVNTLDVDPFAALLTGSPAHAAPEPTTGLLGAIAVAACLVGCSVSGLQRHARPHGDDPRPSNKRPTAVLFNKVVTQQRPALIGRSLQVDRSSSGLHCHESQLICHRRTTDAAIARAS